MNMRALIYLVVAFASVQVLEAIHSRVQLPKLRQLNRYAVSALLGVVVATSTGHDYAYAALAEPASSAAPLSIKTMQSTPETAGRSVEVSLLDILRRLDNLERNSLARDDALKGCGIIAAYSVWAGNRADKRIEVYEDRVSKRIEAYEKRFNDKMAEMKAEAQGQYRLVIALSSTAIILSAIKLIKSIYHT